MRQRDSGIRVLPFLPFARKAFARSFPEAQGKTIVKTSTPLQEIGGRLRLIVGHLAACQSNGSAAI